MALSQTKHEEPTISITVSEYERLLDQEYFLLCLKGCGVDNWEGWDDAWAVYEETKDE